MENTAIDFKSEIEYLVELDGGVKTQPHKMSFGDALATLKSGGRVQRTGWNGKHMWLELQTPDAHSKMGHPYVYMSDVNGKLFPWNPNNLDMLADDWCQIGQ